MRQRLRKWVVVFFKCLYHGMFLRLSDSPWFSKHEDSNQELFLTEKWRFLISRCRKMNPGSPELSGVLRENQPLDTFLPVNIQA